jgi:hypothetical protein
MIEGSSLNIFSRLVITKEIFLMDLGDSMNEFVAILCGSTCIVNIFSDMVLLP